MCRVVEGVVCTLLIYVDDVLVIVTEAEFERLREVFTKEFRWITMESGNRFMLIAIPVRSWPIYRKLGFKVIAENTRVESLGHTPALVLRLDVPKALRGLEEIDQSTFRSVYLPVARYLGLASYTR